MSYLVPNSNYVASNPSGIPKRQISLRPTPARAATIRPPFIYPNAAKQGLITRFLPRARFLPAAGGRQCIVGKPRNCAGRYITVEITVMPKPGAWGAQRAGLPATANHLSFHVNLHFKSSYISRETGHSVAVGRGWPALTAAFSDTLRGRWKERNHPIFRLTFHLPPIIS